MQKIKSYHFLCILFQLSEEIEDTLVFSCTENEKKEKSTLRDLNKLNINLSIQSKNNKLTTTLLTREL